MAGVKRTTSGDGRRWVEINREKEAIVCRLEEGAILPGFTYLLLGKSDVM